MCVEFTVLRPHAKHWEDKNKELEFQRELDFSFLGEGLKYFWFAILFLVQVILIGVSIMWLGA